MTASVAPTAPDARTAQLGKPGPASVSPDGAFALMVRKETATEDKTAPASARGDGVKAPAKPADKGQAAESEPSQVEADQEAPAEAEAVAETETGTEIQTEVAAGDAAAAVAAPLLVPVQPLPVSAAPVPEASSEPAVELAVEVSQPGAPQALAGLAVQPEADEASVEPTAPLAAQPVKPSAPKATLVAAAPAAAPAESAEAPADRAAAPEPQVLARVEAQSMAPAAALVETVATELAPVAKPAQPLTFKPALAAKAGTTGAAQSQSSSQPQGLFGLTEAASHTAVAVQALARTGGEALPGGDGSPDTAAPAVDLAAAGPDRAAAEAKAEAPPIAQPPTASNQTAGFAGTGAAAASVGAGTVSSLAAEIARKLEAKASRFEVQLDPLGLGQVMVQVKIDAGGRLSAALSFENAAAAAQMHARAGELRAQLEQAGFDLSRGGLSFDAAGGQGFGDGRGSAFGEAQDGAASRGRAFGRARQTLDLADVAATPRRAAASGLDLRI